MKSNFLRKVIFIYTSFLLLLVAFDSFAVDGLDKPIKKSPDKFRYSNHYSGCFIYKRYTVTVQSSGLGETISARKRSRENELTCDAKSQELIMIIGGTDSTEYFVGVSSHFLFTDSGTGPDGRGLGVYDLIKKKNVYYAIYSPIGDWAVQNDTLIFYKDLGEKVDRECPDAEKWLKESGLGYGFEQKTEVDLTSLVEKPIGNIACSQRQ